MFECMYNCMYVCMYVCMQVYMYACMNVCMKERMHTCGYIYVNRCLDMHVQAYVRFDALTMYVFNYIPRPILGCITDAWQKIQ